MYKPDLVLNNPQWLICHKTKPLLLVVTSNHIIVCKKDFDIK